MDSVLKSFTMNPGIIANLTKYEAEGGWIDGDHIRFRASRPEKIGGWVRETVEQSFGSTGEFDNSFSLDFFLAGTALQGGGFTSAFSGDFNVDRDPNRFTGVSRAMRAWTDLNSVKYLASAGTDKVEVMKDGIIYDITPVRQQTTLVDALTSVNGSKSIQITMINHGGSEGDYINIPSSTEPTIAGVVLNAGYQIITVLDGDNFTINAEGTADADVTNGGGTFIIQMLLANGLQDNGGITGWGGGTWGSPGANDGGWSMPRADTTGAKMRQWSLDNWGQDLLACLQDGNIYHWALDPTFGTRLVDLDNAPQQVSFMMVAQPSRNLVAFGCNNVDDNIFDPLNIRWASSESLTDWTPTEFNTAGEFRIPNGDYIVCAVQTKGEILIFTNTSVYTMVYVGNDNGLNDIFRFTPIATNISIMGPHAVIDVNGVVYWMGKDNFYMYNGLVQVLPTTLDKYVFSQFGDGKVNQFQKEKCYCGMNGQFNELWWFYPIESETENGHYIKLNWIENVMDYGTMERTSWVDRGIFDRPYGMDPSGRLYVHEEGLDADGQPMDSFITTAYFDIDDGDDFLFVNKLVPDVKLPAGKSIQITVYLKRYPHPDAAITTKGPFLFSDGNNKLSVRGRGRQMAIKFEASSTGSSFELGKMRLSYQPDGGR